MRHYRDEGIFDGVPNNHDPFPESLDQGGPDIVLHQHLQHRGARHPHGGGRHGCPQNQAGDEEHPEIPQRSSVKGIYSSGGAQPHQMAGKSRTISPSQKLGVARPMMAMERPA